MRKPSIISFVKNQSKEDNRFGDVARDFAKDPMFLKTRSNIEAIVYMSNSYKNYPTNEIGRFSVLIDFIDEFIKPIGIEKWNLKEARADKKFDLETIGFAFK